MRPLAHDALTAARRIYAGIRAADALATLGDDAGSRQLLATLASQAASELPVLDGVLAAQAKAAEDMDRAQGASWSPWGRIPVRPKPEPHPDAANDEHPTTPEKPGDTVG